MDYRYWDEDMAVYLKLVANIERAKHMRTFDTGATRDTDNGKHDYEGYLSPLVLRRYAEYMTRHRVQPDGAIRASDNWTKGMPKSEYLKSLLRHVMSVWLTHRGCPDGDLQETLCGVMFNAMGYLFEDLREQV